MPVGQLPFQTRGTNTSFGLEEQQRQQEEFNRQQCVAKGGKWDSKTKTCIFTEEQQVTQDIIRKNELAKSLKQREAEPIKSEDPVLKLARERGLNLQQAAEVLIAKSRQSPEKRLAEASAANVNIQQAQLEQQQNLASQLQGQLPVQALGGEQIILGSNNPLSTAATIGAAGAGAFAGAKTGVAIGTAIAPGVGTLIGGVVGGIGGAIGGAYVKLSIQEKSDVKKADVLWKKAKQNKNEILNMVNSGLITEGQARGLWAEEKSNIALAHSYLKEQTQSDLKNFLGSPGDELISIEAYLQLNGLYDLEFERALLTPNPNRILNQFTENESTT